MSRISNLLAWSAAAVVAGVAVLNWQTLMAPAPLNLLLGQIEVPLGAVILGAAGVLAALFFIASLHNRIGSLLESRRLHMEIQRVRNLADNAEASRVENLHRAMTTEFRLLNERLDGTARHPGSDGEFRPFPLSEITTRRQRS